MSFGSISRLNLCSECRFQNTSPVDSSKKAPAPRVCKKCGVPLKDSKITYRASIVIAKTQERETLKTLADARSWLVKKREEKVLVESGAISRAPAKGKEPFVTYGAVAEGYLAWMKTGARRPISPKTQTGYKVDVATVLKRWKKKRIAETTKTAILEWRKEMAEAGLAPQTQRNRIDRLAAMARYAVEMGLIPVLPCNFPRPAPGVKKQRLPPAETAYRDALERLRNHRVPLAVFLLAGESGLRASEIVHLDGGDVSLKPAEGALGWIQVRKGKGGKDRVVPILSQALLDALEGLSPQAGTPLLPAPRSYESVRLILREGLGDLYRELHSLRHRAATVWANDPRLPIVRVSAWLGHASLLTTQRYVHADVRVPEGICPKPKARVPKRPRAGVWPAYLRPVK